MANQPPQFGLEEDFLGLQTALTDLTDRTNELTVANNATRQDVTQLYNEITTVRQIGQQNFQLIQNVRTQMENAVIFADPVPLPHGENFQNVPTEFTFANLLELPEVKDVARRFVEFLQEPAFFVGAQLPRVLLLIGEHGVGKRHTARTIATEAGARLLETVAIDTETLIDNNGNTLTFRSAFDAARRIVRPAQPIIIFIANVEKLCQERLNVEVNKLMNTNGVLLVGTTMDYERALTIFTRGALYRKLTVPMPLFRRRLALIRHWTQQFGFVLSDLELQQTAQRCNGRSLPFIHHLLNTALIHARRDGHQPQIRHIHASYAPVMSESLPGWRIRNPMSITSSCGHEIGHSAIAILIPDAPQPLYITIAPNFCSYGHNVLVPIEDEEERTAASMRSEIMVLLGGPIGEQFVTGHYTVNCADDIEKAATIARSYIELGFSPMGYVPTGDVGNDTKQEIDDQIRDILRECDNEVRHLFDANSAAMWMATMLLARNESLPGQVVTDLFLHLPAQNLLNNIDATLFHWQRCERKVGHAQKAEEVYSKVLKAKKTLDDDSDGEASADMAKWVERSRKFETKCERPSRKCACAGEPVHFGARNGNASDGGGGGTEWRINCGNSIKEFGKGRETVLLILQDKEVLEDGGDEVLINPNMLENERHKLNVERRKKKDNLKNHTQRRR